MVDWISELNASSLFENVNALARQMLDVLNSVSRLIRPCFAYGKRLGSLPFRFSRVVSTGSFLGLDCPSPIISSFAYEKRNNRLQIASRGHHFLKTLDFNLYFAEYSMKPSC